MAERADNYAKLGDLVFFGEYPTYLEKNEDRIKELNALAGKLPTKSSPGKWTSYGFFKEGKPADFTWYIDVQPEEDGKRYRGVYFTEYRPFSTEKGADDNPTQKQNGYQPNVVYWFSVEAIWWNAKEEDEKTALLVANDIIDARAVYSPQEEENRTINGVEICRNNYAYSDLRKWLNKDFLDYTFTKEQKKRILKTKINNVVSENRFACEDTEDYVFLLSREEADRLYKDNEERKALVTDYAKCLGALCGEKDTYVANRGQWWLRTPDEFAGNFTCGIDQTGDNGYFNEYVNHTTTGVVPAMIIKL